MSRYLSAQGLGGPLTDRDQVAQASSPIPTAASWQASLVALAQRTDQDLAQFPARLSLDVGVDGLVGDLLGGLVGVHLLESARNLLRGPTSPERHSDLLFQRRSGPEFTWPSPMPRLGLLIGPRGFVARATTRRISRPTVLRKRPRHRAKPLPLSPRFRSVWIRLLSSTDKWSYLLPICSPSP